MAPSLYLNLIKLLINKARCPWWRHQMEIFSALLAICAGNSPVPVNSPHKGQWRGALMFSLICVWINGWVNNGEAGDLKRHRSHYDVIVIIHQRQIYAKISFSCSKRQWVMSEMDTRISVHYSLNEASTVYNFALKIQNILTHWGLVTPYGGRDLGQHWLR